MIFLHVFNFESQLCKSKIASPVFLPNRSQIDYNSKWYEKKVYCKWPNLFTLYPGMQSKFNLFLGSRVFIPVTKPIDFPNYICHVYYFFLGWKVKWYSTKICDWSQYFVSYKVNFYIIFAYIYALFLLWQVVERVADSCDQYRTGICFFFAWVGSWIN